MTAILKPGVFAGIDVQQHSGQRTPGTTTPMCSSPPLPVHQSRSLQCHLHPRVADPDAVLLGQLLVKMAHVEIEILLPVELQHLLGRLQRNSFRARPPFPPVVQPVVAVFLVAFPPPPHGPVGDADNLGRLPPLQTPGHRFQNHCPSLGGLKPSPLGDGFSTRAAD